MKKNINLIWAQSANGVIGVDGELPWHLPEDLAYFRDMTRGKPVLMGRKTWDSLPDQARPLPGRQNIVLTGNHSWYGEGAVRADSMTIGLALSEGSEVWVIGGSSVYEAALPLASRVYITWVNTRVHGENITHAPVLSSDEWSLANFSGWKISSTGLGYAMGQFVPTQR